MQLDRPVFIRNQAGAKLTPAGEQFQRFANTLVQVWARAQRAVALPPGRETVVSVGAELSLWNPLLRHWLLWMRRECPEIAIRTQIDTSERLMGQVQDGSLDLAVIYAAPSLPGVIAELLFEERSEEHTSELQSLMRISYAVFCLKTKKMMNMKHKE